MSKKLIVFIIIIAISAISGVAYAKENPHMSRGKDWLELKNYDKARDEFETVINEEPKNIEARYYIAKSFYEQGYLGRANKWCNEILRINKKHKNTKKLKKEVIVSLQNQFLSDGSPKIDYAILEVLKNENIDVFPLIEQLAKSSKDYQRKKVFELLDECPDDNSAQRMLNVLLNDPKTDIKEEAATILVDTYNSDEAKSVLAKMYHAYLQEEIAKNMQEQSSKISDRTVSKILKIAPKLDDPSFAGEFAELICAGRFYGVVPGKLMKSATQMGGPALPYLSSVLNREQELKDFLREVKGFSDKSQIDWRFHLVYKTARNIGGQSYNPYSSGNNESKKSETSAKSITGKESSASRSKNAKNTVGSDQPISKQRESLPRKQKINKALQLVADTLEKGKTGVEKTVSWDGQPLIGATITNNFKFQKFPCREFKVVLYESDRAKTMKTAGKACRAEGKWYPYVMFTDASKRSLNSDEFDMEFIGGNW